jgi:hypothetical protein
MKKAPLLITAMIGLASATFAQPPAATYVTFGEPVELNHLTTDQEDDVMGIISRLDPAKLHALAADSWEGQIPAAAEKGGAEALRLNLSDAKLSGAYTLDSEEGDTLAACWTRGDDSGHKLWLWDTPSEVSFLAEVSPALIGDNNRLVEYSEGSSTGTTLPGSR